MSYSSYNKIPQKIENIVVIVAHKKKLHLETKRKQQYIFYRSETYIFVHVYEITAT